jgi:hypothetical protein
MNKDIPAFPVSALDKKGRPHNFSLGMTLRDWFAGTLISGYLAGGYKPAEAERDSDGRFNFPNESIAEKAYQLADAMLAEREKPRGELKPEN